MKISGFSKWVASSYSYGAYLEDNKSLAKRRKEQMFI